MKILITGASGFVGKALCRECVELGWNTVAVSRRTALYGRAVPADLCERFDIPFRPDVVVHAAARSSPWGRTAEFEAQNIQATRNVIDFCERSGRPHLIHLSTSAVLYRNEHQYGLNEETPPPAQFINEYARTKYAAENLVRNYTGRSCILRPRAVFGPGDTVIFPRILRAAQEGRFPKIESDEPVMADLIYIDCLVQYIVRCIEQGAEGLYHVTNNEPVAILSFLQNVFERLGIDSPTRKVTAARALRAARAIEFVHQAIPFLGEPAITPFGISVFAYSKTLDVQKALRDLGPPSLSLREGVDAFVRWHSAAPLRPSYAVV